MLIEFSLIGSTSCIAKSLKNFLLLVEVNFVTITSASSSSSSSTSNSVSDLTLFSLFLIFTQPIFISCDIPSFLAQYSNYFLHSKPVLVLYILSC